MITHQIVKYSDPVKKRRIKAGGKEHLEYIYNKTFDKVLNDNFFQEGKTYSVADRAEKGHLIDIVIDYDKVEWTGMKVRFLELWFPSTNEFALYHPSDLKRN